MNKTASVATEIDGVINTRLLDEYPLEHKATNKLINIELHTAIPLKYYQPQKYKRLINHTLITHLNSSFGYLLTKQTHRIILVDENVHQEILRQIKSEDNSEIAQYIPVFEDVILVNLDRISGVAKELIVISHELIHSWSTTFDSEEKDAGKSGITNFHWSEESGQVGIHYGVDPTGFNEAMTEYYRMRADDDTKSTYSARGILHRFISSNNIENRITMLGELVFYLEDIAGEEALHDAYFRHKTTTLELAVEKELGSGIFIEIVKLMSEAYDTGSQNAYNCLVRLLE